jgi:hypothetical protein
MEYNTSRNKLEIPEYGRNVQKMVEQILDTEDREKRNQMASAVVRIMAGMNAVGGTYGDMEQKVWDHLYIISDFRLDVDAPYPMPDKNKIMARPKPLEYAEGGIRLRTYGRNLEDIIKIAIGMENGDEKTALIQLVAYNMKKSYLTWNRLTVDDEQIKDDFIRLSGGKLEIPADYEFPTTQDILGKKKIKEGNTKSVQSKFYNSGNQGSNNGNNGGSNNPYKAKRPYGASDNKGYGGKSNYTSFKKKTN